MVEYTIEQWIAECLELQRVYKNSKTEENKQSLINHYDLLRDVVKASHIYIKDIEELEKLTIKQWNRFLKRRSQWLKKIRDYKRLIKNYKIKVKHPETLMELEMIETAKITFRNIRKAYDINMRASSSWIQKNSKINYNLD